jgi:hypothetical protein
MTLWIEFFNWDKPTMLTTFKNFEDKDDTHAHKQNFGVDYTTTYLFNIDGCC